MISVEFLGPMSHFPAREVEASTLQELKDILSKDESLQSWLDISAVAVNDEIIKELSYPLHNGDKVLLLPPVCGG
ncbi:MoaD/ThiS family protein [Helicobacter jaachi]|uniref:MoaD/ThiS family protein n=1 Tax=Helicobacter jaachi TaxID=1677920 RepID=A0A4U8TAN2_9HELI|nr:MoaD/ThiS family protein [Helicobacter jaachi]TLD96208.1 MoaD/ThiS family protein [Helicobacter jaachi]